MPDISAQLRTYFDATVERVTEEDVRIRAVTARGIPIPSPRFRPRPLAAGAIGFGLAMTLLGVVLVADRIFGGEVADAVGHGGTVTTGEPGTVWLFVPVVFGLGLLATGMLSARRRNGDVRRRGEGSMQTIEKVESVESPVDKEILSLKKRNRWLGALTGILAVAVVGLGVWLAAELTSSDGATIPEGVEAALDDYYMAWTTHDQAAFLDATTADFTLNSNGTVIERASQAARVGVQSYFGVEVLGRTISGDGPYYVGSAEIVDLSSLDSSPTYFGHSIMTVIQVDGSWKVSQHSWVGEL
ncbi:MAG: hypothetical protein OEP52_09820 [Acidimicrobiia bacterium]|nr:hypothetical protein [Acidimicrobiia bacterium]